MKQIITLLLITTSSFCQGQARSCELDFTLDSVIHSYTIVRKTNGLGEDALYIRDGVMTINDSLESIKALLDVWARKDSTINELYDQIRAYDRMLNALNGFYIPKGKDHYYNKERNIFYKATGQANLVKRCQCDACLSKKVKSHNK